MMTDERVVVATSTKEKNNVPVKRTHCPLTTALLQQPGLLVAKGIFEKNLQVSQTTASDKVNTSLMPAIWMLMGPKMMSLGTAKALCQAVIEALVKEIEVETDWRVFDICRNVLLFYRAESELPQDVRTDIFPSIEKLNEFLRVRPRLILRFLNEGCLLYTSDAADE